MLFVVQKAHVGLVAPLRKGLSADVQGKLRRLVLGQFVFGRLVEAVGGYIELKTGDGGKGREKKQSEKVTKNRTR
jgi:hypothetical protein